MTISSPIFAPIITLVLWSFVMWAWMYATRIPAIAKAKMRMDPTIPNGIQMSQLPPRVRWKADNYNHLMEQPTVFYAVALVLAVMGAGTGLNLTLAWAYVAARIVHSLHQALWNKIELRFAIFVCSSLILLGLTIRAAMLIFSSH